MSDEPDTPSRREHVRLAVDNLDLAPLGTVGHGKGFWVAKAHRHGTTAAVDGTDQHDSVLAMLDELEPVGAGRGLPLELEPPAPDVIEAMKAEHAKAYKAAGGKRGHPPNGEDPSSQPIPLTPAQWLTRELAPPDFLLGELFSTTARIQLSADTGLGKSMFGLALALAMTLGRDFLHWKAQAPGQGAGHRRRDAAAIFSRIAFASPVPGSASTLRRSRACSSCPARMSRTCRRSTPRMGTSGCSSSSRRSAASTSSCSTTAWR